MLQTDDLVALGVESDDRVPVELRLGELAQRHQVDVGFRVGIMPGKETRKHAGIRRIVRAGNKSQPYPGNGVHAEGLDDGDMGVAASDQNDVLCYGGNHFHAPQLARSALTDSISLSGEMNCRVKSLRLKLSAMASTSDKLRSIPSVDRLVNELGQTRLPRRLVTQLTRELLQGLRVKGAVQDLAGILGQLKRVVDDMEAKRLQPVINGTGIGLHTNLGRAPMAAKALGELQAVASGYCNLEFQLSSGKRGQRGAYLEHCLKLLLECEDVAVVNNCAAGLLLVLNDLVREERPEVIISRGELVQIGGGFRIPDVLVSSGAQMVEVGTTNRTDLNDYEQAISDRTGLIMMVHRSNFSMRGFVDSPRLGELVELGQKHGVPVVYDQGSGALLDTARFDGLEHETTAKEALEQGVDLVCMSGDKLLGGPQAGLVCGRANWVVRLKKNPLYRALRCDKLRLAALQSTIEAYLNRCESDIPIYTGLVADRSRLRARAQSLADGCAADGWSLQVETTVVEMGGGTLPESQIPSVALTLRSERCKPEAIARRLRLGHPPIVGYVANDRYWIDFLTIDPACDTELEGCLSRLTKGEGGGDE